MEDRVKAAVNAGAKIFVSFHLNSSVSSAASGAEVIVPNNSWKAEVGAAGRKLGEAILDELVAIGLGRRSVYSKDTTIMKNIRMVLFQTIFLFRFIVKNMEFRDLL